MTLRMACTGLWRPLDGLYRAMAVYGDPWGDLYGAMATLGMAITELWRSMATPLGWPVPGYGGL